MNRIIVVVDVIDYDIEFQIRVQILILFVRAEKY